MKRCRLVSVNPAHPEQLGSKLRRKLGPSIGYDVIGEAMVLEYVREEEFCRSFCGYFCRCWTEVGHLRQPVDTN